MDRDAVAAKGKVADLSLWSGTVFAVPGIAKLLRDPPGGQFLPGTDFARSRVDFGGIGEQRLLQPLIHDVLVLDVVEAEDGNAEDRDDGDGDTHNLECLDLRFTRSEVVAPKAGTREFNFYGQVFPIHRVFSG